MAKRLGLTQDQVSKLEDAWQAQGTQMKSLWQSLQGGQITADQAVAQAKTIRSDLKSQLQQILTADQLAAMENLRSQWQGRFHHGGAAPSQSNLIARVDDRADFLAHVLTLSDQRSAQVKSILEATVPQRLSLQQQLGSGAIEPEEMAIRIWQIEKDAATQIRTLLTEAQAQRFDALIKLLPLGRLGPQMGRMMGPMMGHRGA